MDSLLRNVDLITRQRDRTHLDAVLVNALRELSGADLIRLYKLQWVKAEPMVGLAAEFNQGEMHQHDDGISGPEGNAPVALHPELAAVLDQRTATHSFDHKTNIWQHQFLVGTRKSAPAGFITLSGTVALSDELKKMVIALIQVFDNCNDLLDYCEVDTLTGLLNRKTFDEYLFKILSRRPAGDTMAASQSLKRRKPCEETHCHWIGVLDIDHFKHINDGFGHAIGDEVLLMLANRMRAHFRADDKLFRFGGEEFVLLLKPTEAENALAAFDRFRQALAQHPFPQVGKVTVSIGFDRLEMSGEATLSIENADRALYWAKQNGRNQVSFYRDLINTGALQALAAPNSEVELF
jgi:diguanylate cyclase (GGDEF)-like protein